MKGYTDKHAETIFIKLSKRILKTDFTHLFIQSTGIHYSFIAIFIFDAKHLPLKLLITLI